MSLCVGAMVELPPREKRAPIQLSTIHFDRPAAALDRPVTAPTSVLIPRAPTQGGSIIGEALAPSKRNSGRCQQVSPAYYTTPFCLIAGASVSSSAGWPRPRPPAPRVTTTAVPPPEQG
jgi:hypothetical protein